MPVLLLGTARGPVLRPPHNQQHVVYRYTGTSLVGALNVPMYPPTRVLSPWRYKTWWLARRSYPLTCACQARIPSPCNLLTEKRTRGRWYRSRSQATHRQSLADLRLSHGHTQDSQGCNPSGTGYAILGWGASHALLASRFRSRRTVKSFQACKLSTNRSCWYIARERAVAARPKHSLRTEAPARTSRPAAGQEASRSGPHAVHCRWSVQRHAGRLRFSCTLACKFDASDKEAALT